MIEQHVLETGASFTALAWNARQYHPPVRLYLPLLEEALEQLELAQALYLDKMTRLAAARTRNVSRAAGGTGQWFASNSRQKAVRGKAHDRQH